MSRQRILSSLKSKVTSNASAVLDSITEDQATTIFRTQALAESPIIRAKMEELGVDLIERARELLGQHDQELVENPCAVACFSSMCVRIGLGL